MTLHDSKWVHVFNGRGGKKPPLRLHRREFAILPNPVNYLFRAKNPFFTMLITSINRLSLRRELDLSCREEASESQYRRCIILYLINLKFTERCCMML
jgi:hypothetical protein